MERRDFIKKTIVSVTGIAGSVLGVDALAKSLSSDSEDIISTKPTKKTENMKIVVLTGSPRRNGNTSFLADQFINGATESGHDVFRFDCASHKIEGCLGCNACGMNGPCVLKDDFGLVRQRIVDADMVVFVTPMYYFGFSAQLKKVIDRFYAINGKIKGDSKKSAFIMAYANTSAKDAQPMIAHYQTLVDYLGWKDVGQVIAPGMWTEGEVNNTTYADKAYQLGKKL